MFPFHRPDSLLISFSYLCTAKEGGRGSPTAIRICVPCALMPETERHGSEWPVASAAFPNQLSIYYSILLMKSKRMRIVLYSRYIYTHTLADTGYIVYEIMCGCSGHPYASNKKRECAIEFRFFHVRSVPGLFGHTRYQRRSRPISRTSEPRSRPASEFASPVHRYIHVEEEEQQPHSARAHAADDGSRSLRYSS
jgi:hypothetical protein